MAEQGPVPTVTVVIPTYKRPEMVRAAVRSMFGQTLPASQYEVIVADSSPDDQVVSVVEGLAAEAPFTLKCCTKEPEGPGPSRNMGAGFGRGEFFAFMDSDCVATPRWLEEGLAAFEPGVGIILGKTMPEPVVKRGVFSDYIQVESEGFIYATANIFYRREAFEQGNGFQYDMGSGVNYRMGGEDIDLAWRLKRLGWGTGFAAGALVYHEVRPMPVHKWLVNKYNFYWPRLVGKFPELRQYFFWRYFYDRNQACLLAGLISTVLSLWSPLWLLGWLPYILSRSSEPTGTLKGPLRLLRSVVYLPRDLISLLLLLAGSVRFRALLI